MPQNASIVVEPLSDAEVVEAWLSLDDLFSSYDREGELHDALEDESGVRITLSTFDDFGIAEWGDDDANETSQFFYGILLVIVSASVKAYFRNYDDALKQLSVGLIKIIKESAEIRRSFTFSEFKEFLASVYNDQPSGLSNLDNITGLYLTLKALDSVVEEFDTQVVLENFEEIFITE